MPDHYRTLIQSLMQLGFLFSRLGESKQEVWRHRQADKEVMFDRREVSASREAAEKVVKHAKAAKSGERATGPLAAASGRAMGLSARGASASAARSKAKAAKSGSAKPGSAKSEAGKSRAGKSRAGKPKSTNRTRGKAGTAKPRRRPR
jgi:hypothetical protein